MLTSIRLIMSLATTFELEIEQSDEKATFLHCGLEEEVYMRHPEGFTLKGEEDLVYKLKKSLYGLKQSPKMWYPNFDMFI